MKRTVILLLLICFALSGSAQIIRGRATHVVKVKKEETAPCTYLTDDYNKGRVDYYHNGSVSKLIFALGPRFTYHFNPYFGADFKINTNFGLFSREDNPSMNFFYNFQFMAGIRGNTPAFYRCMSGYAAARFGYGVGSVNFNYLEETVTRDEKYIYNENVYKKNSIMNGIALEVEGGLNLTRNIFAGFVFSMQGYKVKYCKYWGEEYWESNFALTFAARVGYNFGK